MIIRKSRICIDSSDDVVAGPCLTPRTSNSVPSVMWRFYQSQSRDYNSILDQARCEIAGNIARGWNVSDVEYFAGVNDNCRRTFGTFRNLKAMMSVSMDKRHRYRSHVNSLSA